MSLTQDLREEIRYMLRASKISQKHAALYLGISEKHLSQMLTGRATLRLNWAEEIAQLCGRQLIIASTTRREAAQ